MKIGLYFGSFNPIHTGHLIIANYCATQTDLDQVWFVVSPQNPFKKANSLLNEYHRLHLVNICIENESKLKASNVEFKLPKPSYTVDTLVYLKEKHTNHEFALIMGSDGFQNLDKWKNAEQIIKHHEIYIYKRPGFEIENNIGATIKILEAPLLNISSTYIRSLIKEKKSFRYLVTDKVYEEIVNNNYYN